MLEIIGYISAVFIGLSLGLMGGGGSILTVPILVYLFGIDAVLATGYSLFVVGVTSAIGVISHYRKGNVNIKNGLYFGLPSILSVFISRKFVVPALPDPVFTLSNIYVSKSLFLLVLFALLMVLASYFMIKNPNKQIDTTKARVVNTPALVFQGLLVGLVTGFLGAGGGFLIIPALVLFAAMPMKKAVGTSLMIITLSTLIGFTGEIGSNKFIDYHFLLIFSAIAVAGILIGSWLTKFVSNEKLKPAFGWFVLAMGSYILIKELFFHQ